jgi:hypothetical protein
MKSIDNNKFHPHNITETVHFTLSKSKNEINKTLDRVYKLVNTFNEINCYYPLATNMDLKHQL